jgi:hypothetical protein
MASRDTSEPTPGTYQHYKGGFYEVLGVADDTESGKRYVVYRSLGLMENLLPDDPANEFHPGARVVSTRTKGALAVCPVGRFTELVDGKEYHPGRRVPRFRPVAAVPPPG